MVKRVRRLVSGQSEVARICGYQRQPGAPTLPHTPTMTTALWNEWKTSRKLLRLFEDRAKDPAMSIDTTAALICDTKNISESPSVTANLKQCLLDIKGVSQLIAAVKAMAASQFDNQNKEHEKKLQQLWHLLLPGQERSGGRFTREWGRIGFQQSDPASDFRGGGILGLEQLLFLASTRTSVARRMISEPSAEESRYPWACVGINLTAEVIRMLEGRQLDMMLYEKSLPEAFQVFHSFYADVFETLHSRWLLAEPENLLAFPPVLKETMAAVEEEVSNTGSLVPPGAQA